mmetsp:Transcript_25331/g.55636  ORF Transcript_25331/g.55636 Transcript_25331/m.55636 type:complete len:96 (-) Transcript_25331:234-521(-)
MGFLPEDLCLERSEKNTGTDSVWLGWNGMERSGKNHMSLPRQGARVCVSVERQYMHLCLSLLSRMVRIRKECVFWVESVDVWKTKKLRMALALPE